MKLFFSSHIWKPQRNYNTYYDSLIKFDECDDTLAAITDMKINLKTTKQNHSENLPLQVHRH